MKALTVGELMDLKDTLQAVLDDVPVAPDTKSRLGILAAKVELILQEKFHYAKGIAMMRASATALALLLLLASTAHAQDQFEFLHRSQEQ